MSGTPGGSVRPTGRPAAGLRGGHGIVLVVEDDLDFRELLVEHLVASGRSVRAVGNGAEALAELTERGDEIGLVLLDLWMPVMDGVELCRRLEAQGWPRVPIVVMTAEHDTRRIERFPSVRTVLFKPLDLPRLDALVAANVRV